MFKSNFFWKNILIFFISSAVFFFNANLAFSAEIEPGLPCVINVDTCKPSLVDKTHHSCLPSDTDPHATICKADPFGQINPPDALKRFIGKDPTGSEAISTFLTNLIALIYSIAFIVLIFMLLWGAFDWLTSGGEKEKVAGARDRITYALIGILLFAIAFAVIRVIGTFTGFKFFNG